MACGTEDQSGSTGIKLFLMENGLPILESALYHSHNSKDAAKFTLTGVIIKRLAKQTELHLKAITTGIKKSYFVDANDVRISISQKRWW
jgi:activator of 2-hydroxyglutaryl-CoA dehydratase